MPRRKSPETEERERLLKQLEQERRRGRSMESDSENYDHTLTVKQFANRVHRNHRTVYAWISSGRMPEGSVVDVMGHTEIVWKIFTEKGGIKPVK